MNPQTALGLLRRTLPVMPPPLRKTLEALFSPAVSTMERLADFPTDGLPLQRPVVVRWNEHQVPFIEAETDHDLAFGLGMVHQHLRAGQIALFKRFFYGRVSEMVGPLARDLDHAIRILDYGHAADEWERRMPEETRAWVQAFVDGLNAYQDRAPRRPPEFALLGMEPEPYTFRDILVGSRFAGTDFTWLTYFPLLAQRGEPGFATLWNRTLETGEPPTASTRPDAPEGDFEDLLLNTPRSGSNSVAVSPRRSATGAALIANDPHLGLSLPNLWILLGLRSPSYHAVGLSIVGLPMLGLGRNPDLAWGGTNLRAASSDLYDVSKLDAGEIETKETVIRSRWWRPIRRTRLPVARPAFIVANLPVRLAANADEDGARPGQRAPLRHLRLDGPTHLRHVGPRRQLVHPARRQRRLARQRQFLRPATALAGAPLRPHAAPPRNGGGRVPDHGHAAAGRGLSRRPSPGARGRNPRSGSMRAAPLGSDLRGNGRFATRLLA